VDDTQFNSPLPSRQVIIQESPQPVSSQPEPAISAPLTPPKAKKNFLPYILGTLIVLLLGFVLYKFVIAKKTPKEPVTLNYWGLWEDESIVGGLIADFEAQNPNIKINYEKSSKENYRSRLAGRLGKNPGATEIPDIFRIHSSWIPMFKDYLTPVPATIANSISLDKDFYKVYSRDLKIGGNYYAIPLMYDALVLYYNQDLIKNAGVELPKSWLDLKELVSKLTVRDDQGNIQIAGIAMGTTDNIDHWSDIIGLLLRQNGATIDAKNKDDNDKKIIEVLNFYTGFRNDFRTWNEDLLPSTKLFSQGKLAFYFGPSWRVFDFAQLNPNLNYAIAPVPQMPTLDSANNGSAAYLTNIHWATYWVEGVNVNSPHQAEAWKFLEFLSSRESLEKFYSAARQTGRDFGEIYPRISMAQSLKDDSRLKIFTDTADFAQSGYLSSFTHDEGLNTELSQYFKDAINSLNNNNSSQNDVLTTLKSGIDQVVSKYSLNDSLK